MTLLVHSDARCPLVTAVATGPYYTTAQIEAALPKANPKPKMPSVDRKSPMSLAPVNNPLADAAAAEMAISQPKLWKGDWTTILGFAKKQVYPSQSEADMALASQIAHDLAPRGVLPHQLHALTENVFNRSGLAQRDKWLLRPDYRHGTITKACASAAASSTTVTSGASIDWSVPGDVRNAKFFAEKSKGSLAYIHDRKRWMRWENSRWAMCHNGEEIELAKNACRAILAAAGQELSKDPEKGQKLVREAAQAHLAPRIRSMVDLAKSDPALAVSSSMLDADPFLLGVGNGVVDLRTGMLAPNAPGLYVFRHCDADFTPSAQCPRFLTFFDEVFDGDQATITAVQRLLGYSLVGLGREEIIIFCVGYGANGKSIFGNVTSAIIGEYAKVAPSSLLAARRADDHGPRSDLAMLQGARMVSINELPAGMQLDEQMVKQLAGREPISARHLYGDFFTYQPRFTPWVRTNHKPIVKGEDDGIWRRIVILPFRRKFAENEQDPALEGKLLNERDGILRWMVEGAQKYLKHGIQLSPAMKREQAQYRKDSDMLGEFLEECTTINAGDRVEQSKLFLNWTMWCAQNGVQHGSKKAFTQRVAERGFATTRSNGRRFYDGLRIKSAIQLAQGG